MGVKFTLDPCCFIIQNSRVHRSLKIKIKNIKQEKETSLARGAHWLRDVTGCGTFLDILTSRII